ncbi:hypothetical protein JCM14469_09770 [Desulfatiferula olefinivorans]
MAMIRSMQQYGRGAGRIPMPRALARTPRNEWPVSPSLVIFFLAVLIVVSLKVTTSSKKLFKLTQTIIILPQTEKAPEPTVPKNIPLIKVLKDAAKKTVEPKRREIQKIVPKKIEPKKITPKKIEPKKIDPLKALPKKIEPRAIARNQIKPLAPAAKKIDARPIEPKRIDPIKAPLQARADIPAALKSVPLTPPPTAARAPRVTASASTFTAIPEITRTGRAVAAPAGSPAPAPLIASAPASKDPLPTLTQWEAYKPPVPAEKAPGLPAAGPRMAPAAPQAPIRHIAPAEEDAPDEDLVIIKSSLIGNSERVKTLKRAIMKKARNMDPSKSPYIYKVRGYTCTLIVEDGVQGKIIIDFSPADAPFDVVSALERMLPR